MQSNSKHILLISYVFPPYYGIGGRRWANHANELTRSGYVVHVICAKNPFKKQSLWTDIVVNNPNIVLYPISTMYPNVLVDFNHNFIQKVQYKFYATLLPLLTKGSFFDRAVFWKVPMLKQAKEIIKKNNIRHVISTGAPFGNTFYTTLLRRHFDNLFILNDLRDPWTWGPNWGFPDLLPERMAFERLREYETIRQSDYISTPSEDMVKYLKEKYPLFSKKFIQIPHYFDANEITIHKKNPSSIIRFVMYGNIYQDIDSYLIKAAKIFSHYKGKVSLDVYTDQISKEIYFKNENATNVCFYPQIELKILFDKFKDYDWVFLFNPKYNVNNISTKFYEIIYSKTPLFLFCEYGLGPKFLIDNNLGKFADINTIDSTFEKLVNNFNFNYNTNYDISPFSLPNVTQNIIELLENNCEFIAEPILNKKQMLFTFDYELFLGDDSGSVLNSILKPTELILNSLKKLNLKNALFFVDTLYLYRLQNIETNQTQSDYLSICNQLIQILKNGHFIFPHIHAHWYNANYNKEIDRWSLTDLSLYRFHAANTQQQNHAFEFSIQLIKDIQLKANIFYNIDSYRAGGWCIQPLKGFKPYFIKYGIKNDFSVLKNFSANNPYFYYNFKNFPHQTIYNFEDDISTVTKNGTFKEYSITSISVTNFQNFVNKVFLKIAHKLKYINYGDGKSVERLNNINTVDETLEEASQATETNEMCSIELLTLVKLRNYKQNLDTKSFIHFISHPKMISKHNIYCFENLMQYAIRKFTIETDYKKM